MKRFMVIVLLLASLFVAGCRKSASTLPRAESGKSISTASTTDHKATKPVAPTETTKTQTR